MTADVGGILPAEPGDLPLEIFLRQTERTRPGAAIAGFAREFAGPMQTDRLDTLHEMMSALRERVSYEAERTDASSTAAEAFETGYGVCQDHAHIFISAARLLGVPARYVSGYLYDVDAMAGGATGHAWAAAWIEGLGWVSFDVSNGRSASETYVSIAVGLDYDSASPIRGMRTGGEGGEALEVSVTVSAAQQ